MLQDLTVKLMEQANDEVGHKGWCDHELSTNEQTRKEKTDDVETLHSEIDSLTSSISKLNEEIQNLNEEVAEINKNQAARTEERTEEKSKNEGTIADAQE